MKLSFVYMFPGQGSQYIGMGKDLYDEYTEAKEVFDLADEIANGSIKKLCFKGPIGRLTKTVNLQLALTAVNVSLIRILKNRIDTTNGIFIGHSLGEYSALYATQVLNLKDVLTATWMRGQLMHEASKADKGSMVAIRNLSGIQDILEDNKISIANWNAEDQLILTGRRKDLKQFCQKLDSQESPTWLNVSGAWHSDLMRPAETAFNNELEKLAFNPPESRLLLTTTLQEETDPEKIKNLMASQITKPVLWLQTIKLLLNQSARSFVEIGPKLVLTNLVRKIAKDQQINLMHFGTTKDIINNLAQN